MRLWGEPDPSPCCWGVTAGQGAQSGQYVLELVARGVGTAALHGGGGGYCCNGGSPATRRSIQAHTALS